MSAFELQRRLEELRDGGRSVADLLQFLRDYPYQDLDFARVDHHRPLRTGFPEAVLGVKDRLTNRVKAAVAAAMDAPTLQ